MALLRADLPEAVDLEDREIIEKLAKLQNMHSQVRSRHPPFRPSHQAANDNVSLMLTSLKIGGLRSLLPEKLIDPARMALDNPGQFEPEKLAIYLQTAAKTGGQDLEKFKKDWHSDEFRELWHTVNTNDLPQGGDAWSVDYSGLLQETASNEQTSLSANNASSDFQPPNNSEIVRVVDEFRARHPDLKIHVSDGPNPLPIDIEVAELDLRVEEKQSTGGVEYLVVSKPGADASKLRDMVLRSISESPTRPDLTTFLVWIILLRDWTNLTDSLLQDMVASYQDLKHRPCHKCQKVFHTKTVQLPVVRRLTATSEDQSHPQFLALHRDCR
jgi:hypothetical protein